LAEAATVGNYRLERELGRGGMGAVYAGVHKLVGRRAAVKVLLPDLSAKQELVERFFNEARAAGAVKHPSIVDIYDFGYAADGSAYIVMELLEGETLAARLKAHGPLAIPTAVALARQVANALSAAHAVGIVHRDLKPDNVFLVRDPEVVGGERVKLLDFGIAKLATDTAGPARTVTGAILGTPHYMSPEQCEGSREVDGRTDLYSLGCMLFQMLTGSLPFDSAGIGGLIGMHLHVAPPLLRSRLPQASIELEAVVARLLAKPVEERFQSAEAVAAALAAPSVTATHAAQVEAAAQLARAATVAATEADLPASLRPPTLPEPAAAIAPTAIGPVGKARATTPLPRGDDPTVPSMPPAAMVVERADRVIADVQTGSGPKGKRVIVMLSVLVVAAASVVLVVQLNTVRGTDRDVGAGTGSSEALGPVDAAMVVVPPPPVVDAAPAVVIDAAPASDADESWREIATKAKAMIRELIAARDCKGAADALHRWRSVLAVRGHPEALDASAKAVKACKPKSTGGGGAGGGGGDPMDGSGSGDDGSGSGSGDGSGDDGDGSAGSGSAGAGTGSGSGSGNPDGLAPAVLVKQLFAKGDYAGVLAACGDLKPRAAAARAMCAVAACRLGDMTAANTFIDSLPLRQRDKIRKQCGAARN
jgi:hypothetical protein